MWKIKGLLSSFNYLVEATPHFSMLFILPFLVFFVLILTAAIVSQFWAKKFPKDSPHRRLLLGIKLPLIIFSLAGLLLIFFNWQELPYLSMKILLVVLQVGFAVWLFFFLFYLIKKFPKELVIWQNKMRKQKYLKRRRQ